MTSGHDAGSDCLQRPAGCRPATPRRDGTRRPRCRRSGHPPAGSVRGAREGAPGPREGPQAHLEARIRSCHPHRSTSPAADRRPSGGDRDERTARPRPRPARGQGAPGGDARERPGGAAQRRAARRRARLGRAQLAGARAPRRGRGPGRRGRGARPRAHPRGREGGSPPPALVRPRHRARARGARARPPAARPPPGAAASARGRCCGRSARALGGDDPAAGRPRRGPRGHRRGQRPPPYRLAIRTGRRDLAELLAELGAERRVEPIDELLGACFSGHAAEAQRLAGAHPDALALLRGAYAGALPQAAAGGNATAVEILLGLGVPADTRAESGQTALAVATGDAAQVAAARTGHGRPRRRASRSSRRGATPPSPTTRSWAGPPRSRISACSPRRRSSRPAPAATGSPSAAGSDPTPRTGSSATAPTTPQSPTRWPGSGAPPPSGSSARARTCPSASWRPAPRPSARPW